MNHMIEEEVYNPFPKCRLLRRPRHLLELGLQMMLGIRIEGSDSFNKSEVAEIPVSSERLCFGECAVILVIFRVALTKKLFKT